MTKPLPATSPRTLTPLTPNRCSFHQGEDVPSEGVCSRGHSRACTQRWEGRPGPRARPACHTCWPVPRRPCPLPPGGRLRAAARRQTLDVGCGRVSVRSHGESIGHTCRAGPGMTHLHGRMDKPQSPFCMEGFPTGVDCFSSSGNSWGTSVSAWWPHAGGWGPACRVQLLAALGTNMAHGGRGVLPWGSSWGPGPPMSLRPLGDGLASGALPGGPSAVSPGTQWWGWYLWHLVGRAWGAADHWPVCWVPHSEEPPENEGRARANSEQHRRRPGGGTLPGARTCSGGRAEHPVTACAPLPPGAQCRHPFSVTLRRDCREGRAPL